MLGKSFIGSATGFYKNFEFAVFRSSIATSSTKPVYYVNVVLMIKDNLQLGLDIRKAGVTSKIGKIFLPGKYVRNFGEPELDAVIAIQAKDKDRVEALFLGTGLVDCLLRLYRFSNRFTVSDTSIRYYKP